MPMTDQDKNKLDYLRKRQKAGKLKPDQSADLRKLERMSQAGASQKAKSSWFGGTPTHPMPKEDHAKEQKKLDAWKAMPGRTKPPAKPKAKTALGRLADKVKDFVMNPF